MNARDEKIVNLALDILASELTQKGDLLTSPEAIRPFLRLQLELVEHEIFAVLFLDNRHRLIEFRKMFNGTIDGASVYSREVVKLALKLNSAAVIFAHNHPSGDPSPSHADKAITQRLKAALALVDIRVLDHFVIGHGEMTSFVESGLL